MAVLTTEVREHESQELVALLCAAVRSTLTERADALRRTLPPRPPDPRARYAWLRNLDENQSRQAAFVDRLDALCGHLDGEPALGYDQNDPLPAAALDEADGFTSESTGCIIAEYRRARSRPCRWAWRQCPWPGFVAPAT